jgi:hypothetical protein
MMQFLKALNVSKTHHKNQFGVFKRHFWLNFGAFKTIFLKKKIGFFKQNNFGVSKQNAYTV